MQVSEDPAQPCSISDQWEPLQKKFITCVLFEAAKFVVMVTQQLKNQIHTHCIITIFSVEEAITEQLDGRPKKTMSTLI